MNCAIQGCPGEYEQRYIAHPLRHQGRLIVIDHVPALVCPTCGDVFLSPATLRHLEQMLQNLTPPTQSAPLYECA